jgi:hypothetical protein
MDIPLNPSLDYITSGVYDYYHGFGADTLGTGCRAAPLLDKLCELTLLCKVEMEKLQH